MDSPDNDDQWWHWGVFYYNPNDPREFVPGRRGRKQTINFAHKKSLYMILAIFIPLILVLLVVILPLVLLHPFSLLHH